MYGFATWAAWALSRVNYVAAFAQRSNVYWPFYAALFTLASASAVGFVWWARQRDLHGSIIARKSVKHR